jgi:hypothetical protein
MFNALLSFFFGGGNCPVSNIGARCAILTGSSWLSSVAPVQFRGSNVCLKLGLVRSFLFTNSWIILTFDAICLEPTLSTASLNKKSVLRHSTNSNSYKELLSVEVLKTLCVTAPVTFWSACRSAWWLSSKSIHLIRNPLITYLSRYQDTWQYVSHDICQI